MGSGPGREPPRVARLLSPVPVKCHQVTSAASPRLLERDSDLRHAEAMLAAAANGDGGALVVEGPAGIGKSALLREIRDQAARDGFAILSARGAELERGFSFGVVRQLFEAAVSSAQEAERDRILSGAAHLAIRAIGEPDLTSSSGPAPGSASPSLDASFAVLHGLYWLTSNMSEAGPLLIAVDDAHWSDVESLRFLDYLAGRLEGLAVMLAICARRFEPGSPAQLLSALDSEASARVLLLAPLTESATDELVRSLLEVSPSPGFSAACHRVTGGNPQLIRELLAALALEGIEPTASGADRVADLRADRIAASILVRVGRVGETAVSLARAVAVLGRDATPELAAELAGLDPGEAASAADTLIALEILSPGEVLGFVHPIVRTAVYNDFATPDRGRLHASAARLLSDRGAGLDSIAAQVAAAPAAGDEWAVARLSEAGAAALSRGAPDAAVRYLDRALAERPADQTRRELLLGLGRAYSLLRDRRSSIKRLREALELTVDPRDRAEIVHILFAEVAVSRAGARVIEMLDRELAALPPHEHELGILLESDIDSAGFFSLPAKRAADQRRRRFDDPDDPGMQASAAMKAALYGGTADQAAELAIRAAGDGRLLDEEGPDSPRVWTAGFAMLYSHRLVETVAFADSWIRAASRLGSLRAYSLASSLRTRAAHWIGDLAEAEADVRAFIDGMPEAVGLGPAFLAEILLDQGRLDEAAVALRAAERAEVEVEWSFFYPALLLSRGAVSISQGALDRGCQALLDAGRAAEEWGLDTPGALQWRPPAAEALAMLDERGRAVELIEAELDSCRRYGSAPALGIAMRAAGRIDLDRRGVEILAEAVTELARTPARLEHARALVDLGSALRRARQPSKAREHLRGGLAQARACGARTLAERAHEELAATGVRPRKIVRAGVDALTSSERRVARMAAEGMTNKEIAQDLFVTVRTVEAHLHHTYQKLDIASRTELAAALGPGGRNGGGRG
jgi:DNA-binding CsgD family transcriptional regulator/tetratricopeptide (TPR) repeat protein